MTPLDAYASAVDAEASALVRRDAAERALLDCRREVFYGRATPADLTWCQAERMRAVYAHRRTQHVVLSTRRLYERSPA